MRFNHLGVFTARHKRLLNFYIKKLGFKLDYQTVLPEKVIYPLFGIKEPCNMAMLGRQGLNLEIFWFDKHRLGVSKSRVTGYNHFGLEVADRGEFCRRLEAEFKVKIIKIDRGSHYAFFILDPDRNIIEIKDYPKAR